MPWRVLSTVAALSVVLLPAAGAAQGAVSTGTELQQQMKHRRHVVQPKPDPQAVTEDIGRGAEALVARERFDRTVRDSASAFRRRPDLDHDVSGGIQSRTLQGLRLPRR